MKTQVFIIMRKHYKLPVQLQPIWILIEDKEYFIPFKDYPCFRESSLDQIFKIRYYPSGQLYWEELDIDIDLKALSEPESFPLIFRH